MTLIFSSSQTKKWKKPLTIFIFIFLFWLNTIKLLNSPSNVVFFSFSSSSSLLADDHSSSFSFSTIFSFSTFLLIFFTSYIISFKPTQFILIQIYIYKKQKVIYYYSLHICLNPFLVSAVYIYIYIVYFPQF